MNGILWDLDRPFEESSSLKLIKFDDPEGRVEPVHVTNKHVLRYTNELIVNIGAGQYVFWHSSAHILGEAMERHYGGCLCYGPPVDDGFYYDMFIEDRCVTQFVCCVDLLCAFS